MIILYLDPGSGSFLLQLLIAALAGIGIAIGSSWSKIKRIFKKNKNKPAVDDDDSDE